MHLLRKTLLIASALSSIIEAAQFGTINTTAFGPNNSVIYASMYHPPINIFDDRLITDMHTFLLSLNTTIPSPKVVIIASTLPGFFMSPLDLHLISVKYPVRPYLNGTAILNNYFDILNLLSTLPQVFIGEVDGNAYAVGNELLMHMDMRFAGPRASIGAPEAAVGFLHVGGLQTLTKLIGSGRSSEWMLSCSPITGMKAAEIGWFNEAFVTASELKISVQALAERIALWPATGITATKASIREDGPDAAASARDVERFETLVGLPEVQYAIDRVIELSSTKQRTFLKQIYWKTCQKFGLHKGTLFGVYQIYVSFWN